MEKLSLKIREKLLPFFKSEDFETIRLGASLFKLLPEYERIKNVHIYNSLVGVKNLSETLNYLENINDKSVQRGINLCLADWLLNQKVQ